MISGFGGWGFSSIYEVEIGYKSEKKSIYRWYTASNTSFYWPVRLCDYFICHGNLNTRKKPLQFRALLPDQRLTGFVIIRRPFTFIFLVLRNYILLLKWLCELPGRRYIFYLLKQMKSAQEFLIADILKNPVGLKEYSTLFPLICWLFFR